MSKSQNPYQLSLDQKIKQCRQVMITNLQKTIQHKMFYMFCYHRQIQGDVKSFSVKPYGAIKVQFNDHQKAMKFYDEYNFKQKILRRKFNISLILNLDQIQIQKVFINGITEENQRAIFDAARKIGICKLNSVYERDEDGKVELKSTGFLSFCRVYQLNDGQINQLKNDLNAINVQITSEKVNKSDFQKKNGHKEKIQQKIEEKKEQKGEKVNDFSSIVSMPQAKLLVGQGQFSITFRYIPRNPKSIIVIPFGGDSLNLYPGEQMKLDKMSNSKKLPYQLKTLPISSVCMQIQHDLQDQISEIRIFTRIDNKSNIIQKTLENIINSIEKLNYEIKQIECLTIPLSILTHNSEDYSDLIEKMISLLQTKNHFIKRVNLTASNVQEWKLALKAFYQTTAEMLQNEKIKF